MLKCIICRKTADQELRPSHTGKGIPFCNQHLKSFEYDALWTFDEQPDVN